MLLQDLERELFGKKEGRPLAFSAIPADQWVALSIVFNEEIKHQTNQLKISLEPCVKILVADAKEPKDGRASLQTADSS